MCNEKIRVINISNLNFLKIAIFFVVPRIKSRASHMLGKLCTTKPQNPTPLKTFLTLINDKF
jgi:hypothetical protein